MLNFIARRIVFMFVALWAVTLISFFIINLPEGDYVTAYIAQLQATGSMVDAEEADNLRKFYGLGDTTRDGTGSNTKAKNDKFLRETIVVSAHARNLGLQ